MNMIYYFDFFLTLAVFFTEIMGISGPLWSIINYKKVRKDRCGTTEIFLNSSHLYHLHSIESDILNEVIETIIDGNNYFFPLILYPIREVSINPSKSTNLIFPWYWCGQGCMISSIYKSFFKDWRFLNRCINF